jgi:hypothetical protein
MKKQTIITLIAIVAILVTVIFAGCVENEAPASTQAPTPTPTPSAYILITKNDEGSLVDHFGFGYERRDADSGYFYLIQDYTIVNHGYKTFTVSLPDFYVIVDNVKYDYDASTYSIESGLKRVELLDGGTTSGKIVFAIPKTACGANWVYSWGYETPYNVVLEKGE